MDQAHGIFAFVFLIKLDYSNPSTLSKLLECRYDLQQHLTCWDGDISWSKITQFGNRGGLSTWVHTEKVLFVLHIIQAEYAQKYFSKLWQFKFFLIAVKKKEWVTCHFSVSFSYFSCHFTRGNKQIVNHSQKEQIFDIPFHTLHIVTALLRVGDFFYEWKYI